MKKTLIAIALTAGLAQSSFAFVATTTVASETNAKGPGNINPNSAQVGDTFSVADGGFTAYVPGVGDPTITGGDLGNYQFTLNGTVMSVVGGTVEYTGTYEIFYALGGHTLAYDEANAGYSSGTLSLDVDFAAVGPDYVATGELTQTSGPSVLFTSQGYDGFADKNADFTGTYIQSLDPADGSVFGVISSVSVPDTASTFALFGSCVTGLAFLRRKLGA